MMAMESDVQDGKLFVERERVIYAKISDLNQLNDAASADSQVQWQIRIPKTENNSAKGTIRVRKVVPMNKRDNHFVKDLSENGDMTQYVLTTKVERQATDRREVPVPVTRDMFDLFSVLADNGMTKDRYHFPIYDTELVFEVDVFLKEDGTYYEWVKIDLELVDIETEIPPLPFKVEEVIYDNTKNENEKKRIRELYDTIFLSKNSSLSK
jgi:CYTH domain-containing protein